RNLAFKCQQRISFEPLSRGAGCELQPYAPTRIRPPTGGAHMRFGDERESSNFEDVTGRSGLGFGGGGLGGGGLGCLIPLIASRFGIGGVIVLVIGYFLLSSLGGLGGGGGGSLAVRRASSAGN